MNNQDISKVVSKVIENLSVKEMTLSLAQRISAKVIEKAKEMGVNAVVAIADKGANPILVLSMDDAYIASYDIAVNKAYTCASLKMSTKKLQGLSQPGQPLYGIQFTNQGKIVIFGGG
ncbi:MAG: heme-binding protein, partial [Clostridia bacterium]|nr:heme-binding protein [Clostridia bacterium]